MVGSASAKVPPISSNEMQPNTTKLLMEESKAVVNGAIDISYK